jgi:hypothetical protein
MLSSAYRGVGATPLAALEGAHGDETDLPTWEVLVGVGLNPNRRAREPQPRATVAGRALRRLLG